MTDNSKTIASFFIEILRNMDNNLNFLFRDLISNFKISTFVFLILISFIYGIIHSIGPGHGKSLVASFFLKEKHPLKKSLILSVIISVIHTGSAVVLSFLLFFVLTSIKGMFRIKMQSYFMAASGLLILIIGILFLFLKIFRKNPKNNIEEKHSKNGNLILIGVSAGIVPCPASLMIMLLALSKNIICIGLTSVLSISLGMFFLLTIIGVISIKSRDGIIFFSDKTLKKSKLISIILEYFSIVLIIIIGLGMSLNFILSFIR